MHWAAPHHAWLLLLLPPAMLLWQGAVRQRRRVLESFSGEAGRQLHRSDPFPGGGRLALFVAAFLLGVIALCRPQWGSVAPEHGVRGPDLLIALDVSRSMLADDLAPNRLAAARLAITGLLPALQGERIGLIAFAGQAFMVCPPTDDYATFSEVLAQAGPDLIPLGGTSLARLLAEAARVMTGHGRKGGNLIVLSDGESHDEGFDRELARLRAAGIVVDGVAVGTERGGLIPLENQAFLRDGRGAIVLSRVRPDPLRAMATATGGQILHLASEPAALNRLHAQRRAAQGEQQGMGSRASLAERFQIPLAVALLLLFLEPMLARPRP